MAEADLQQFLEKVRQLNAFVALSEQDPQLRQALSDCSTHHQVVDLARSRGFDIGRRWGDAVPPLSTSERRATDQAAAVPAAAGCTAKPAGLGENHQETPGSNLLGLPCPPPGEEHTTVLACGEGWRLERIHSCQASSPPGFWYDQDDHEWVTLLQGTARLRFADEPRERELCRGDSLLISAGRRHRVESTDPAPGAVWLALFWREACAS